MKTLRILLLVSVLLGMAACGGQGSPEITLANSSQIIITNGTVVDGRGSEPIHDGIVAIGGDRITFVGRAADYSQPVNALVIDARGGTILPGIIDSHVLDASDPAIRREFLMSGVTTVCSLGSTPTHEQQVTIETALGIVRRFHELGSVVGSGTDFNTGLELEAGMQVGEMEMLSINE